MTPGPLSSCDLEQAFSQARAREDRPGLSVTSTGVSDRQGLYGTTRSSRAGPPPILIASSR